MRPVEAVDGLERAEAGESGATREIHRDARSLLEIGELLEGLGGTDATLVDVGQERSEGLAADTPSPMT
jgi:hypothetical protein